MEESSKALLKSEILQGQTRLLHAKVLRSEMAIEEPLRTDYLQPKRLLSSAQALQMAGIELLEKNEVEEGKPMLERASQLYEYLAQVMDLSPETQLELLLLAAITASLADRQANAYVLSHRLPQEMEVLTNSLRDNYSTFSILAILILRRKLTLARRYIIREEANLPTREQTLIQRLQSQDIESPNDPIIDGWRFLCLKYYLQGNTSFLDYLETGQNELFDEAIGKLERILTIFSREGDVEYWYIVHAVYALMLQIKKRCIWNNVYSQICTSLVYQYCYNLASPGYQGEKNESLFELWPSQIHALSKGLLDNLNENVLVPLPTSSGKTRIAEMAILTSLNQHPERLCVYIAPYRALVEDIRTSLSLTFTPIGFRVASMLGGAEYIGDETQLADLVNVIIVTPEKLDLILRRWPEILSRIGLVVFDEGHIIADKSRGLRSEFLLARLLRQSQKHEFRIVFMSAMVPNVEDFQQLLRTSCETTVSINWRPNRQLIGEFSWYNQRNRKDRNGEYGRVNYLTDNRIYIPRIIVRKHYPVKESQTCFDFATEEKSEKYPKTPSDTQAALALQYEKLGPVLVFSATKPKAESVGKSLCKGLSLTDTSLVHDEDQQRAVENLAARIAAYLGQHKLIEYVRQGFALHHADFPQNVRLLIEDGFRQGYLRILVATTTLAQGVNLPIKTVIVGSVRRGKNDYVPVQDYKNIIGRAGRANHETEGNVILCFEHLKPHIKRRYSDLEIEEIRSRLWRLWEELIKERISVQIGSREEVLRLIQKQQITIPAEPTDGDNPHPIDSELFTILTEEAFDPEDEDSLLEVLSSTLFAHQCTRLNIDYRPFVAYLSARHQIVQRKFLKEELQTTYYQTGLPLKSCNEIAGIIEKENPPCINQVLRGQVDNQVILELAELAIRSGAINFEKEQRQILSQALSYWLEGEDISNIVRYVASVIPKTSAEEICKVLYSKVSRSLSWVVGGILLIAAKMLANEQDESDTGIDIVQPDIEELIPAYLKYGVNTKAAVWACILGVEDRKAAIKLGQFYTDKNTSLSFTSFSNWFLNLNYPEMVHILGDANATQRILNREIKVSKQDSAQQEFLRAASDEVSIQAQIWKNPDFKGSIQNIVLRHDENNPDRMNLAVFTSDGRLIGYVARNTSVWLTKLPNNLRIDSGFFSPHEDQITVRIKRVNKVPSNAE